MNNNDNNNNIGNNINKNMIACQKAAEEHINNEAKTVTYLTCRRQTITHAHTHTHTYISDFCLV